MTNVVHVSRDKIDYLITILREFFNEDTEIEDGCKKVLDTLKNNKERYVSVIINCVYHDKSNEYIYRRLEENNVKIEN